MIEIRQTERFARWFAGLRDVRAKDRIVARIRRFELGNVGDVKPVGGPILEARIDHGPGYRLYFVRRGHELLILLAGGDKSSQRRDIAEAQAILEEIES